MLGIHGLRSSLRVLFEQGMESVSQRIAELTAVIVEQADRRGFELLSPRQATSRGGIVSFRVPDRQQAQLYRHLMDRQVICAYRGGGIRFSPHFHNTGEEIIEAFHRIDKAASNT
jgi:selenocysteine lyase/cysteine desulfurase